MTVFTNRFDFALAAIIHTKYTAPKYITAFLSKVINFIAKEKIVYKNSITPITVAISRHIK